MSNIASTSAAMAKFRTLSDVTFAKDDQMSDVLKMEEHSDDHDFDIRKQNINLI